MNLSAPPDLPDTPPAPPAHAAEPPVWGAWATVGWGLLVTGVYFAASIMVVFVFAIFHLAGGGAMDAETLTGHLARGEIIALAALVSVPVEIGLVVLIIKMKRGSDLRHYLALKAPSVRSLLWVAGVCLAMIAVFDGVSLLLGRPVVAPFMVEAYVNCSVPALLWLALVVAAPVVEEVVFRSFLLQGWKDSAIRPWGAVILSSIFWTSLHAGYDLYALTSIFVAGLLLGFIWLRTRSVWLCIFMHALMNLIATLETAWVAAHP